ncbi:MAG TPA: HD domain-containing phosphohydrolase [Pyrinomonadaceae bacterium]|nr:HD domain-containing phosphohydrolase [Pyrinomonadaceae bacterium]
MKYKILLVDDEPANLRMLERLFSDQYDVLTAGSGADGLEILASHDIALILSDQRMPGMTGLEFLQKAAELRTHTVRIVLTGYTDVDALVGSINSGVVYKYITKPWSNPDLQQTVIRGIQLYETAKSQHSLAEENQRLQTRMQTSLRAFVELALAMLDVRSPRISSHSRRTAKYAIQLGKAMLMDDAELEQLSLAALLHEVAHIKMPAHLLSRTTMLREGEMRIMQDCFRQGVGLLSAVPELGEIAANINFQHDHFDGYGSSNRLSGDQIPVHSRIIAIADAYDEMRVPTMMTKGFTHEAALLVMQAAAGRKYDPALIAIFCGLKHDDEPEPLASTGSQITNEVRPDVSIQPHSAEIFPTRMVLSTVESNADLLTLN